MCIAFWKLEESSGDNSSSGVPPIDFVLAFNRDEFFDRPTQGFHIWPENPNIYAPKDLKPPVESHRGSWIGVNKQGRLALLTNFREAKHQIDLTKISRGSLVRNFLLEHPTTSDGTHIVGDNAVEDYAKCVFKERHKYDGFNLVLFDLCPKSGRKAIYVTNRGNSVGPDDGLPGEIAVLSKGEVAGLSNSTIEHPWPKVVKGKKDVLQVLGDSSIKDNNDKDLISSLMKIMSNSGPFSQSDQPQKLADLAQCIFVPQVNGMNGSLASGKYGTRTTNILILRQQTLTIAEYNHDSPASSDNGRMSISHFTFD